MQKEIKHTLSNVNIDFSKVPSSLESGSRKIVSTFFIKIQT